MTNQKLTALMLAGALALGLCGGAVLAADPVEPDTSEAQQQETGAVQTDGQTGQEETGGEDTGAPDSSAGGEDTEGETPGEETPQPDPDPEGTLSFANVDSRVRAGNLNYLVLEETIAQAEATDYDKLMEDLRERLNDIANMQWGMITGGGMLPSTGNEILDSALQGIISASNSSAAQSLQVQYDAVREQFDAIKDGTAQQEAADGIRQLEDTQNNLVLLTESMYVQLSELQATRDTLQRALDAMDRQVEELELRYELGQISSLALQQAKSGRTTLASQKQSVDSSISTLTMNLQSMVGDEPTGTLRLSALPQVTDGQLEAMDLEADLAAAKEASYTLYAAKKTLDDAEETYQDAGQDYNYNENNYQFVQAQHAWQAAQYTYAGAVQSFELSFRTLYTQVKDYQQVLQAAQTALAVEQDNYAVDQLKYEQGTISENALRTAEDDLATAQDTVNTARRNLFSAYNNYRWAVDYGILN